MKTLKPCNASYRLYFLLFILVLNLPLNLNAYSLLTHEAIIDVSWKSSIEPLLLKKYPNSSTEILLEAHSYAYGGAIMPDIGYSPFGSMTYTDFVHNVRTGDYVQALLEEAENVNEYAFALGSLAHYMADNYGHSLGTNVAVPLVYPKVKLKFGNTVTYADNNISHSRMEFAFDVLQTARGNYATKNYHDLIGFKVARSLIEKAFHRTYGFDVNDVFKSLSVAINTYRWTIKSLLPNIVRTAWANRKSELKKTNPGLTGRKFAYRMKNKTYYYEFGKDHVGSIPTIVAVIIPILPKIGPLAKLRFKTPTPEAEALFIKSFDSTLVHYEFALKRLNSEQMKFQNRTLDTGHETALGKYRIADDSYAEFLFKLRKEKFEHVSAEIKNDLIEFYSTAHPPITSKKDSRLWKQIAEAFNDLNQSLVAAHSSK